MNPPPPLPPAKKTGTTEKKKGAAKKKKMGGPPRKMQTGEHFPPFPQHDVLLSSPLSKSNWTTADRKYYEQKTRFWSSTMNVADSLIEEPLRNSLKMVFGDDVPALIFWIGADRVKSDEDFRVKPGTMRTFAIGKNHGKCYTVYEATDSCILTDILAPRELQNGDVPPLLPQHDVLLAAHWRHQTAANKAYVAMDIKRSLDPTKNDVQKHIKEPLKQILGVDILPKFWVGADHVANPKHWAHQAQYIKPGTSSTFAVGIPPYLKVYTVYEMSDDGIRFGNYNGHHRPRGNEAEQNVPAKASSGVNYMPADSVAVPYTIMTGMLTDGIAAVSEAQRPQATIDDSDAKPPAIVIGPQQIASSVASNTEGMSMSSSAVNSFLVDAMMASSTASTGPTAHDRTITSTTMETDSVTQSSLVPGQSHGGTNTAASPQLNSMTTEELESIVAKMSLYSSAMPSPDTVAHSFFPGQSRFDLNARFSWLCDAAVHANTTGKLLLHGKMLDDNDAVLLMELLTVVGTEVALLDLSANIIDDFGLVTVAKWLEKNTASALVKLDVSNIDIGGDGDDGAAAFGRALAVNTKLQELNLSLNKISKVGTGAIAEGLQQNKASALVKLHLHGNDIGDNGAVALGEALEVNSTLQELDLSDNKIGNVGAMAIAKGLEKNTASALVKLNVHGNAIRYQGAAAFGKALEVNKALKELVLSTNKISNLAGAAIANGLEKNAASALVKLNLGHNYIGEKGAVAFGKALAVNKTLKELSLCDNSISSIGAMAIAKGIQQNIKSALLHLDLIRNNIGDDGAVEFGKTVAVNTILQSLYFDSNNISHIGAVAIAEKLGKNTALVKLSLNGNDIHDEGAVAFGKALAVNTTLQQLDFYHNKISHVGAVEIAEGLGKNTASALLNLDLTRNNIGDIGAVAFWKVLKRIQVRHDHFPLHG